MTNLTSTAPAVFNALYELFATAGQAYSPPVAVFHSEVVQYEPASYVLLKGVANHQFQIAALGSYANEETYEVEGEATVLGGDVDPQSVLVATYALFQAVVMSPVIANNGIGGNPLVVDVSPSSLIWIVPSYARYSGEPGAFSDGAGGFAGCVEWAFSINARLAVA